MRRIGEAGTGPAPEMDGQSDVGVHRFDVILVGGGLANQLIALRLAAQRPALRIAIIERGPVLGGNHTWSCHETDLLPDERSWVSPLMSVRWMSQRVAFPDHARALRTGYGSILSDGLARHVAGRAEITVLTNSAARALGPDYAELCDGLRLMAPLVIDGRGALQQQPLALAFQKFYGLEVECEEPHGEADPVIMDATVPQIDGYRFVYTLPMSPTRILIEDTYYSDGPALSDTALEARIRDYAAAKGWRISEVVRAERGVLPITLAGDIDAHWATLGQELPRVGLRAWLFHSTTGYSLPLAVRTADAIAAAPDLTSNAIARLTERLSRQAWDEQGFMRLLNRLLFVGARPEERVAVMSRFYRLDTGLIERFYAGRSTMMDKARVFSGKPPIPVFRGLGVIPQERAWEYVAARGSISAELG